MSYYRFMLTALASSVKLLFLLSIYFCFSVRTKENSMHLIRSHFPQCPQSVTSCGLKRNTFYNRSLQLRYISSRPKTVCFSSPKLDIFQIVLKIKVEKDILINVFGEFILLEVEWNQITIREVNTL